MVDECRIGPISILAAHLEEDNTFADGKEEFTLITNNIQALRLIGLVLGTERVDYGNVTSVTAKRPGWGLLPIDTSSNLVDNEDFTHRGYYLITSAEPTPAISPLMKTKVTAEKIANLTDYLSMDYTSGYQDGTTQEYNYTPDLTVTSILDDTFSGAYSDNWQPINSSGMSSPSCATSGGYLVMSGTATSDSVMGGLAGSSKLAYTPSWISEFDLTWVAQPAGYEHIVSIYITASIPHTFNDLEVTNSTTNWLRFFVAVSNSAVNIGCNRCVGGYTYGLFSQTNIGTYKTPKFKVQWDPGGIVTIWQDADGGGWVKKWGPQNIYFPTFTNPGFNITFHNRSSTTATGKINEFKLYNYGTAANNNVIALPAGTDFNLSKAADFNRVAEDGNQPCYVNPTVPLYFSTSTPASFYKGAVQATNTNYTGSTPYTITRNDEVLNPAKFSVSNGLVKLTTNATAATPIIFSYWSPSAYTALQQIGIGETIKTLRPLYIGPERQTYQINDTKWTMFRGKPFVKVEHPNTTLNYIRNTYYFHDGATITSPAANADVTMTATPYINVWGAGGDVYRFQIYQLNPTTIKSDSIPATNQSGLGVYATPNTGYQTDQNVAKEFRVQPFTNIGVK